MKTNKSFLYWQWRTIIVTMVGYALFYFVRKNFSFAIPGLRIRHHKDEFRSYHDAGHGDLWP